MTTTESPRPIASTNSPNRVLALPPSPPPTKAPSPTGIPLPPPFCNHNPSSSPPRESSEASHRPDGPGEPKPTEAQEDAAYGGSYARAGGAGGAGIVGK
ncbi:hypothetical protein MNV49_006333 [Pseudohyphozyma bogoriensis]|nr:hypothetical protein MNV49_006333 [Pseudohyphozyma bogoriensis]